MTSSAPSHEGPRKQPPRGASDDKVRDTYCSDSVGAERQGFNSEARSIAENDVILGSADDHVYPTSSPWTRTALGFLRPNSSKYWSMRRRSASNAMPASFVRKLGFGAARASQIGMPTAASENHFGLYPVWMTAS